MTRVKGKIMGLQYMKTRGKNTMRIIIAIIWFLSRHLYLTAQSNETLQDGYTCFYYPNGQISSEGIVRDGKPDGHWKTYYVTGVIKSEGKRNNFLLDSVWVFYDVTGDTIEKINYMYGKKNGYYYTYDTKNKEITSLSGNIVSKELYVNDKKEGPSYYYYDNGKVHNIINYVNGKMQGLAREYSESGQIITLLEYHNGYLVNRERINRTDSSGYKQGVWKEFYPDGKIKTERNFKDEQLHGFYREYDKKGNLSIAIRYDNGRIIEEDVEEEQDVEIRNSYDEDGNLLASGPYRRKTPIGVHREYSRDGEIIGSKIYNDFGRVISLGIVNEEGERIGKWENFYVSGKLQSEGNYTNNQKEGRWVYYYENDNIEQTGDFRNGLENGTWKWYYPNGNLHREEEYFNGKEDGIATEYSVDEEIIAQGDYLEGEKEGNWFYNAGDYTEEGRYVVGLREGTWKHYYENGNLKYQGNYVQGNPHKRHKIYWENGVLKEERYYDMGMKEKTWKKYNEEGVLLMTISYKNDIENRINGVRVDLPESDVKLIK